MKACKEYQETLLMDVHGELPTDRQGQWKDHLRRCEGCRTERAGLLKLLQGVREAFPAPELSPIELASLRRAVLDRWDGGRWNLLRRRRLWGIPLAPAHALALAAMLLAVVGWFGFRGLWGGKAGAPEDTMLVQELELIRNLDLLEEMDVIQQLVQVVDHRDAKL
jgi:hypothetical protein